MIGDNVTPQIDESDIPGDALVSNSSGPGVRLLGSFSSQQPIQPASLARPRDDDGEPFPDGPDDRPPPPPPPPPVSTPDLAIQVAPCLPDQLGSIIVDAVRQAIDPNADVRTACVDQTQRIGIWLRPFVNAQDDQARNRGLNRLSVLKTGETLAFFMNSTLIRRLALEGWDAAPKRLNGDGHPDANGPVHLTGFSLAFESPNRVVTRIEGFDERPWPDVDFKLTITNTLSPSGGEIECDSTRDLDVDTSWLSFLAGLFLVVLPPLGIVFLSQRIIIGRKEGSQPDSGGVGCDVAGMIPLEILIPSGQKVIASYSRLEVSSGGIFAGGSFAVSPRSPEATISGPSQISEVEGTASVSRAFSVQTTDLRPPLQFAWGGDGTASTAGAEMTGFRFSLTGTEAGQVLARRVTIRVTDADNLVVSAERTVQIHITPEEDDGLPPICRRKPWLPQCQEALALMMSSRGKQNP